MQRRDATETIETVSLDEVHSMSCLDFKSDTRCDKILPLLHWRIDIFTSVEVYLHGVYSSYPAMGFWWR